MPSFVETGISMQARRLIWRTFFQKASRGVDFDAHLPWHSDFDTRSIVVRERGHEAVAVAIVRPARQAGVAMIGFVCVDEAVRGKGYGRELVAATNSAIDEAGYAASLLWTSQPGIYASQGYHEIARDSFLHVTQHAGSAPAAVDVTSEPWPGNGDRQGLPAFALSASRLRSERAEVIVAHGSRGVTLINWRGDLVDIVAIMGAANYRQWCVNAPEKDVFLGALPANRFEVSCALGSRTMARRQNALRLDYIPVAERI